MRAFEWVILLAAITLALWTMAGPPSTVWQSVLSASIPIGAISLHSVLEGLRWQMIPLYAALLGAAILTALASFGGLGSMGAVPRFAAPITIFGLALAGASLSIIFPVFAAPPVGGRYAVGTTHLDVTHVASRADGQSLTRRIAVEIWYPASPQADDSGTQYGFRGSGFRLSHLPLVSTRAVKDAPFVAGPSPYPLLLYVPSWSGQRFENSFLLSSLASQGYVVAAIDYPDGEILRPEVSEAQPPDLAAPMEFSSEEAYRNTLARAELRVRSQAKDAIFVLDRLQALARDKGAAVFSGRLAPNAVGMIGFSFGGAVAYQAAWLDHRIAAVLNMDGWMFGDAARSGFATPRFFMSDDTPLPSPRDLESSDPTTRSMADLNLRDDRICRMQLAKYGGYRMVIAGTRHVNFSDRPLYSAIPRLVGGGPIKPRRAASIIDAFAVAFFDKYLKGTPSPLLDEDQSDFPEAKLESWSGSNRAALVGTAR